MAIYFVKTAIITGGTAPSDSNDGLDPIGFNLVNATYDHTGGAAERLITLTNAFTSYTWTAGDQVYLMNAVGGVADGLYEIASKVDASNISLVANAGLTADSTSDVDSSTGPFAGIQKLFDSVGQSCVGCICNDGDHTTNAKLDFDLNAGALTEPTPKLPAYIVGCDARGVYGGSKATQATIRAGTLSASTVDLVVVSSSFSCDNFVWVNVIFNGNATGGLNDARYLFVDTNAKHDNSRFINCRFTGGTNDGYYGRGGGIEFHRCEFDDNDDDGWAYSNTAASNQTFEYCSFHDNGGEGVLGTGRGQVFLHCLFYDNGGNGLSFALTYDAGSRVENCTFWNNGGDGLKLLNSGNTTAEHYEVIRNNTFSSNVGYGINFEAAGSADTTFLAGSTMRNNHCYNNTAGTVNNQPASMEDVITGDPLFSSTTDGSEDLIPTSGSPLLGAGVLGTISGGTGYEDIGALQADASAGGGGGGSRAVIL